MKKLFFVLLTTMFVFQLKAQISVGAQASYLNMLSGAEITTFGAGIRGEFAMRERLSITGQVGYYVPSTFTDQVYGNSFSNLTEPSQILIDVQHKVSFLHLQVGAKAYLIGNNEGGFGVYGTIGGGVLIAPTSSVVADFDSELYYTTGDDDTSETLSNATFNIGLGGEVNVNFGYVFGEAGLILPANQVNGSAVAIEIPPALNINAGVRIPIN